MSKAKVMIVDDDPSARRLARDSLSLAGEDWDIWEADDGRSALDLIRAVRPDVILLDITMPQVGGIPVCSEIKADPLTTRSEIVIVSARTESEFVSASLEAGASEYVTKPFQPQDLVRRVQRLLGRSRDAQPGAPESEDTPAAPR
jgi:two-component system alkaline phosphatase synthesis response regulator PhoP